MYASFLFKSLIKKTQKIEESNHIACETSCMYPNDEWYDLGDLIDFGEKHLWEMLVTEGLHEDAGHRWLINERLATSVKLKVRKIQVENLNKASKNIIVLYIT